MVLAVNECLEQTTWHPPSLPLPLQLDASTFTPSLEFLHRRNGRSDFAPLCAAAASEMNIIPELVRYAPFKIGSAELKLHILEGGTDLI